MFYLCTCMLAQITYTFVDSLNLFFDVTSFLNFSQSQFILGVLELSVYYLDLESDMSSCRQFSVL